MTDNRMPLPLYVKGVITAVGVLAAAVIVLLPALDVVSWDAAQTAAVGAAVAAPFGLATAGTSHIWPGTAKEPVGIAAALTALASCTIVLGNAFAWWVLDTKQTAALVGVVSATLGAGTAIFARQLVTAKITQRT